MRVLNLSVRTRAGFIALLALSLVGLTYTPATAAPKTVLIDGYVYGNDFGELEGATVEAFVADPRTTPTTPVDTATTDAEGSYRLEVTGNDDGITATTYYLRASADGYVSVVETVPVISTNKSDVYLGLERDRSTFGTLAGKVVDADGEPVGEGEVYIVIYEATADDEGFPVDVDYAETDENGEWSVTLPPGSYKVEINDSEDELPSRWVGGNKFETATVYTVTTGNTTTTADGSLTSGPAIEGRVTNARGAGIAKAFVSLHVQTTRDGAVFWEPDRYAVTDTKGYYRFEGVENGTYRVNFHDDLGDYQDEWYDDKPVVDQAQDVVVPERGPDQTLNAQLAAAPPASTPALVGSVKTVTGEGWAGAYVTLFQRDGSSWEEIDSTFTNRSGVYRFTGLDAGQYTVLVQDDDDGSFEEEFYNNKFSLRTANPINVNAAGAGVAAPIVVTRYGRIAGHVVAEDSDEFDFVDFGVRIYDQDGDPAAVGYTDEDGNFVTDGLVPGTYFVRAIAVGVTDDEEYYYIPEFWRDSYTFSRALPIKVRENGTSGGMQITLGRQLAAIRPPTIVGSWNPGSTLTATTGVWNSNYSNTYKFQWTRNGAAIKGQTGRTYKLVNGDLGRGIGLKVIAIDKYNSYLNGSARAATKFPVAIAAKASPRGDGKAKVAVSLVLPGLSRSKVDGKLVRIYDGSTYKATLTMKDGRGSSTVSLSKGAHTLSARYIGTGHWGAAAKIAKVTVK